jgi:hypothetical protein
MDTPIETIEPTRVPAVLQGAVIRRYTSTRSGKRRALVLGSCGEDDWRQTSNIIAWSPDGRTVTTATGSVYTLAGPVTVGGEDLPLVSLPSDADIPWAVYGLGELAEPVAAVQVPTPTTTEVMTPTADEEVLMWGHPDLEDRQGRLCLCTDCGTISRCTPLNDFYTDVDGRPDALQCEACHRTWICFPC